MKVHVTKVSATDKRKDGSVITNKWGKTSWRVGLKTQEHGDVWLNGMMPFNPDRWEGTEQEIEVFEEEYNGTKRQAFRLPKREQPNSEAFKAYVHNYINLKVIPRLEALEKKVTGEVRDETGYPQMTEENDTHGLSESTDEPENYDDPRYQ